MQDSYFSHGYSVGMGLNMVYFGNGVRIGIVTWERKGMGIGKCDKIPEKHSSLSHHSQTLFSVRSLGQF